MAEIKVGDSKSIITTIEAKTVNDFINGFGDDNPLHWDEEYCKKTRFKKPIVHGAILIAIISRIIGTKLPGEGSILISQSFNYMNPVFVSDTVKVTVEVATIQNRRVTLYHRVERFGETALSGESVVLMPK
jgi:acyl dehydratase